MERMSIGRKALGRLSTAGRRGREMGVMKEGRNW
jgi:hypothetical protein